MYGAAPAGQRAINHHKNWCPRCGGYTRHHLMGGGTWCAAEGWRTQLIDCHVCNYRHFEFLPRGLSYVPRDHPRAKQ